MADRSSQTSTWTHAESDRSRHWAAGSQTYAPADVLLRYIADGWQLETLAAVESFYYAGYRRVDVFYFTLKRGEEVIEMPVLANPVTHRLVEERKLTVLRVNAARGEVD
jgi:hypothetical protein